jgi:hypothetical protein
VGAFICQDQRLATPVIANELNIMEWQSTKLLHKIQTWEKCVQRWFQILINDDQKACPIEVSAEMHEFLESFIGIWLL